jgi:hypothetical protein
MARWPPYAAWDLNEATLLPANWVEQIRGVVQRFGKSTTLSPNPEFSEESPTSTAMNVTVVSGLDCVEQLPWLAALYRNELRQFASRAFAKSLYVATDVRSSVNINCLAGMGASYPSHRDTNDVTGLLFACDADSESGGELVFTIKGKDDLTVAPKVGLFLAFDAREIPHYVSPLRKDFQRLSLPMNYYGDAEVQCRPEGLDEYLYEAR